MQDPGRVPSDRENAMQSDNGGTGALREGDRVLARWNGGTFWFPGKLALTNGEQMAIRYDDGMEDIRPPHDVKPLDWRVGSQISAVWTGNGEWYAATVVEINADGTMLTVLYEDGIQEGRPSAFCRSS